MAKFMNSELERIRDAMRCGHCRAVFQGSDSQAWKVKYENRTVYCCKVCRHTALRAKFSTPVPIHGPCRSCGKHFSSRSVKPYCSLDCYINSDQFIAMRTANIENNKQPEIRSKIAATLRTGENIQCLECDTEFYKKKNQVRKFCGQPCYRSFMAKRFDRWIANPEGVALPQCYDEFLDQQELSCIVDGCLWHGAHLSLHVSNAHGFPAEEFKRAAGFNLGSGIVSKPLAQALSGRRKVGVGAVDEVRAKNQPGTGRGSVQSYISLESKEHRKKAIAMSLLVPGPQRACQGCATTFTQRVRHGRQFFCSFICRENTYAKRRECKTR